MEIERKIVQATLTTPKEKQLLEGQSCRLEIHIRIEDGWLGSLTKQVNNVRTQFAPLQKIKNKKQLQKRCPSKWCCQTIWFLNSGQRLSVQPYKSGQ